MAAREKKLTHPLTEAGHSRRCFARLMALLLYFLTALSDSIKETGIQTRIRWFIGDTSLLSSRSAGFPNQVVFLASAPRLPFIGLSCGKQSKLGLGNIKSSWKSGRWRLARLERDTWTTAGPEQDTAPLAHVSGVRGDISGLWCLSIPSRGFLTRQDHHLFPLASFTANSPPPLDFTRPHTD